jgi:YD repeat-containing protein
VTDPFGNVTTYNYNSADQLYTIVPSTGITTTIKRSFNVTGGPSYARYYIDQTGNDGSQTKVWYDKLGRELRTETKKYGGALVKIDKQYDAQGQLARFRSTGTGTLRIGTYWATTILAALPRATRITGQLPPIHITLGTQPPRGLSRANLRDNHRCNRFGYRSIGSRGRHHV